MVYFDIFRAPWDLYTEEKLDNCDCTINSNN